MQIRYNAANRNRRLRLQNSALLPAMLSALLLLGGCSMRNPFVPADEYCTSEAGSGYAAFQQPRKSAGMYRATMKPYCVGGVRYCPTTVSVGEKFRGTASWYGPNFHGESTSNGESYNMYAYTAAHKTLPINTVVRVTNLRNGKSTTVRINDRGPFVKDRIIDLSYQAAKDIGVVKHGTAPVELEVISFDPKADRYAHRESRSAPVEAAGKSRQRPASYAKSIREKQLVVQQGGFSVQIASFSDAAKARAFKQKCYNGTREHPLRILMKKIAQKPIYAVVISHFGSIEEAKAYIAKYGYKEAFVVKE